MPTYEYQCRKCGHEFEKFQSITAAPVKTCPKCRGRVARLVSGGAGIIFKGTGFYQTDYKNAKSPSTSATSGDKPAESKPAESKPAAGAEKKGA
ncbi:MAG TPA: zinc ribbon domain-containing protein [Kiritimatiellia bacterium]|jgi:putative FmdB family regulatory protein|nr:zinc ribbon domain-containing protein [Kiritimatiellia bacterium]HOE36351.1 zinc ribbon domain-containing protein [Kiritimatiellia bacterium]HOR73765.1 zinc ribbon domain-containing protein [Kiritimatiellia bacterium]HOU58410.1 zinc ribbon domain-containing protein [Kiritimatiellia bacterium]HPK68804.1 zinc ribbon domain-containing protein [Kiritimatiellia bacterium]